MPAMPDGEEDEGRQLADHPAIQEPQPLQRERKQFVQVQFLTRDAPDNSVFFIQLSGQIPDIKSNVKKYDKAN